MVLSDNGYGAGALGPQIDFTKTGPQTIRVQPREDGTSIDQIVLPAVDYTTKSPRITKNDVTVVTR